MQAASQRISVVVFVLNAAATIERALASVTADDQPPVELLVLDGGSTDRTLDIIRRYEDKIAFWRSYRDGNPGIALNEGVARATKDVICLLPADDWIEPGALHLVADAFAADPALEVLSCGSRIVHFREDGTLVVDSQVIEPSELELTMDNLVKCPLTGGRFILRRLYNEVGSYNADLRMSNDLDFLIRILMRRPKCAVIPSLVYTYRRHGGSRTLGGESTMVTEMIRHNIQVAAQHLAHSPLTPRERRALLGMHGRGSAKLARLYFGSGRHGEAASLLLGALRRDWRWPFLMPYWLLVRYAQGRGLLKA